MGLRCAIEKYDYLSVYYVNFAAKVKHYIGKMRVDLP